MLCLVPKLSPLPAGEMNVRVLVNTSVRKLEVTIRIAAQGVDVQVEFVPVQRERNVFGIMLNPNVSQHQHVLATPIMEVYTHMLGVVATAG